MKLNLLSIGNHKGLIEDVKLFKLKINRDPRGSLTEMLRIDWPEIFGEKLPFSQSYFSITNPGVARDENLWHCHPTKQVDRFVIIKGAAVFALFDNRENSKTKGTLNLFLMGEQNSDDNQFLLLVPQNVYHGFCVVGENPCYLINFPTTLYDKTEEGRVPIKNSGVKLPDGSLFSWQAIREYIVRKK